MKMKFAALGVAALGLAALPVAGVFAWDGDGIMEHEDQLQINIRPVCTLGTIDSAGIAKQYATVESDAPEGVTIGVAAAADDKTSHGTEESWTPGTTAEGSGITGYRRDVFAYTMQPGTFDNTLATTTFTVYCNNNSGYTLSAYGVGGKYATEETGILEAGKLVNVDNADYAIETNATVAEEGTTDPLTESYWAFKATAIADDTTSDISDAYAAIPDGAASEVVVMEKESAGNISTGESATVTYAVGLAQDQAAGTYVGRVHYVLAQAD